MTRTYYTDQIIPVYANVMQSPRCSTPPFFFFYNKMVMSPMAYGKKVSSRALRDAISIRLLVRPPQSPDLNPMEACWNIIKQRARKRACESIEQLKQVLQAEWSALTHKEIQDMMGELLDQCRQPSRITRRSCKVESVVVVLVYRLI